MDTAAIDEVLERAVHEGAMRGVSASAWSEQGDYLGASGERAAGLPMEPDALVRIFSMTKAITAAAVMQLVERGAVTLDEPAGELVPYLAEVQVLDGFDSDGSPRVRPPKSPVTLRHLLTHTSGFGYDFTDPLLAQFVPTMGEVAANTRSSYQYPLSFDPGTRWSYGIGIDWAGQAVEAVSGQHLAAYLTDHLLGPLAMADTSFQPSATQMSRLAELGLRTPDGLVHVPNEEPSDGTPFEMASGGGGLYSTVSDYLRFTRMILGGGELDGVRVLSESTVALMAEDHLAADLSADGWASTNRTLTEDVDLLPGQRTAWGLSFMINTEVTDEGRSPGSLAWAGAANSFFWIDRTRRVIGVMATQILPFYEPRAVRVFSDFERAVYASLC